MATLRELVTKWVIDVDDSDLKKMEADTKQLQVSFVKMGVVASAALAAVVLPAAALQAAIKDTLTLSEETGTAFADLEKGMTSKALSLSEKLGFSATEVAKGFYQVLSTGAKALSPQFNALSEIALKMAKTVGLEPAIAIERLNDTIKTFQLEGTEAGRVADVLFTASKLAATTVPQLTDAMSIAAPAAVAFGVSLETTTAALATIAEGGIKSSRAGTGLQGILLRLAKASGPAGKALNAMGLSAFDSAGKARPLTLILSELNEKLKTQTDAQRLANLQAIGGQEHFKTLGVLLGGGAKQLDAWTAKLKKSEGALDRAFNIKMSSATEQAGVFWISIKNLAATFGEPLLAPLGKVIKKLSELTISFRKLLATNPEMTKFIGLVIGFSLAVIILGSVMGGAVVTIKLFAIAMAGTGVAVAGTMFWFIALAAMLGILALVIHENWEELNEFWKMFKVTPLKQTIEEFKGWIREVNEADGAIVKLVKTVGRFFTLLENTPLGNFVSLLIKLNDLVDKRNKRKESESEKPTGSRASAFARSRAALEEITRSKERIDPELTASAFARSASGLNAANSIPNVSTINNTSGDLVVNINGGNFSEDQLVEKIETLWDGKIAGTAVDLGQ